MLEESKLYVEFANRQTNRDPMNYGKNNNFLLLLFFNWSQCGHW